TKTPLASLACSRNQVSSGSAMKLSSAWPAAVTSFCGSSFFVAAVASAAANKARHTASPTRMFFMGFLQIANLSNCFDGLTALRGHGPLRQARHVPRHPGRDQDAGAENQGDPRSYRHGRMRALGFSGGYAQRHVERDDGKHSQAARGDVGPE